ncbi:MAG: DMT family transporter [Firmicutes bacterium]|nr:DMT family transporter [Bacillota bacterium]
MDKKACIFILLAGACWGTNGLFFRQLSALGFGTMEVLFTKMLVAMILLGGYLLIRDASLFRMHLRDLWVFLAIGFVGMLAFNYFYFQAMVYNTVAVAVALLYTSPIFVVFLSAVLFKERVTKVKLLALTVIFGGCLCASGIFLGGLEFSALGLFFGIGAGLFYGSYSIFSRIVLDRGYTSLTVAFYAIAISCMGGFFLADHSVIIGSFGLPMVVNVVGIAVFACLTPMLLYTAGLQKVETGVAAMLVTSEPVVAALISAVVLSEPLSIFTVIGIVLILTGIMVMNVKRS